MQSACYGSDFKVACTVVVSMNEDVVGSPALAHPAVGTLQSAPIIIPTDADKIVTGILKHGNLGVKI